MGQTVQVFMAARNIAGKGLQPYPEANPAAVIYFIPFIMVGWMFLPKVTGCEDLTGRCVFCRNAKSQICGVFPVHSSSQPSSSTRSSAASLPP